MKNKKLLSLVIASLISSGLVSAETVIDSNQVVVINTDNDNTGDEGVIFQHAGSTFAQFYDTGSSFSGTVTADGLNVNGSSSLDNTSINGTLTVVGSTSLNTTGSNSTTIGSSTFILNNQTTITGSTDGTDAGLILNGWTNDTSIAGVEMNSNGDVNITANNDNLGTGPEAINLVAGATSSASLSVGADGDGANGFITLNGPTTTINSTTSTLNATTSATVNTESFLVDTGASTVTATDASVAISSGSAGFTTYAATQTVGTAGGSSSEDYEFAAATGEELARQQVVVGAITADGAQIQNIIQGDTLIDGSVYINGSLTYSSNISAVTQVTSDRNGTLVSAGTTVANEGSERYTVDANGALVAVDTSDAAADVAAGTTAALTVTNVQGNTHGIVVTETQTTISGGVNSSSLTFNDNGATFSDSATGTPIQVHGVMDGTADFDAVNVRQFAGAIAAAAAMTNIPQVPMGQKGTFGFGAASFMGKSAIAMGTSYRFSENGILKASASVNNGGKQRPIISIGAGWSW